jgi:outer membrane protein assembly factor BamB
MLLRKTDRPMRAAAGWLAVALLLNLSMAFSTWAACPPSCPIPGGSKLETDCLAEYGSSAMRLNSPSFDPAKPKPAKEHRCFDGEAGCDLDGVVNWQCAFDIDVCLRNADPAIPECTVEDVVEVKVKGNPLKVPALGDLQTAVDALVPATSNVCTDGVTLILPLKGPDMNGVLKRNKVKVSLAATGSSGAKDNDTLRLSCVPHNWPDHGYDHANRRSTTAESLVGVSNVSQLMPEWSFLTGGPVSATPTVDSDHVYVASWDGIVYALDRTTGKAAWEFDTGSAVGLGLQSSVTVTADGRVVVGDSTGQVFCLKAKNGDLLWQAGAIGPLDPADTHIWASPRIANGRVFVGVASHNDEPCVRGHMFAFDLDTGAELWRYATVPEGICHADTTIGCSDDTPCPAGGSPCQIDFCDNNPQNACTTNADCPTLFSGPGVCITDQRCGFEPSLTCTTNADCPACIEAVGGGVTATPAVSADGETLYLATVGCLSAPSVGNSDSIIALDADSGAEIWVHRTQPIEQVADGPFYHDYGFLNGPILADFDDGLGGTIEIAVAGSKDGTLYAVDPADGTPVWSNPVAAPGEFAGFGLFNAPIAHDGQRFYAALYGAPPFAGWPGANDHLFAFNEGDGSAAWSDQIGLSWGATTVANGVVYMGTNAAQAFYAYDAASGVRIHTLSVPGTVTGGAAIVDGTVYVPYGLGTPAGLVAFSLP